MKEERIVFVEGKPYSVVISDEQKELLAAHAAGKTIIGVWNREKTNQSLFPAEFTVESSIDIDYAYLERAVRRTLGMPWMIGETKQLLIREFTVADLPFVEKTPVDTAQDRIFYSEEQLKAYITYQYGFYQYGIWAVVEKFSNRLVGKAGITQTDLSLNEVSGMTENVKTTEGSMERLNLEIGYHIFTPYRNKGYAKEACGWILEYAKDQLEAAVYANIDASNEASIGLAKCLGFTCVTQRYSEGAGYRYLFGWNC